MKPTHEVTIVVENKRQYKNELTDTILTILSRKPLKGKPCGISVKYRKTTDKTTRTYDVAFHEYSCDLREIKFPRRSKNFWFTGYHC